MVDAAAALADDMSSFIEVWATPWSLRSLFAPDFPLERALKDVERRPRRNWQPKPKRHKPE